MNLLIFFFLLAVVISFICSLLEACFLSISSVYIQSQLKKGRRFALILRQFKQNMNRPLSAILTLNTLANTVGAAGVGAQVHFLFGSSYVALFSGILTFVILIFAEIIPKNLGAVHWRAIAPVCAYVIKYLIYITYPAVWISEKINKLLSKKPRTSVTKEEIIAAAEIGAEAGVIGQKESHIIINSLTMDSLKVSEIMTPRSVIFALDQNMTIGEVIKQHKNISYSRIPIFKNNLETIEGMIHRYKIFEAQSLGLSNMKLSEYRAPLHVIPEHISVAATMDQFIKRKEHIFLVVDEYGMTTGLVTLEDAVETILGVEIVDELDSVEDLRKLAIDKWKERKQFLGEKTNS